MFLSFVIDHPDACILEHVLHLFWSGRGGEVYIFGPLTGQQIPDSAPRYPQFVLVLFKQLWEGTDTELHNLVLGHKKPGFNLEGECCTEGAHSCC